MRDEKLTEIAGKIESAIKTCTDSVIAKTRAVPPSEMSRMERELIEVAAEIRALAANPPGARVPEGYCLMPLKGAPEIFKAMRMSLGDGVAMGPVYYAALSAGALAAAPQPEGAAAEAGGGEVEAHAQAAMEELLHLPSHEVEPVAQEIARRLTSAQPLLRSAGDELSNANADWIDDSMTGLQIVDQVRMQMRFERIEYAAALVALEIACSRIASAQPNSSATLTSSQPAAVKQSLTAQQQEGAKDSAASAHLCETGLATCGPVEHWDADGVPFCSECWKLWTLGQAMTGGEPGNG